MRNRPEEGVIGEIRVIRLSKKEINILAIRHRYEDLSYNLPPPYRVPSYQELNRECFLQSCVQNNEDHNIEES